ncbi:MULTISPECIES: hypothetical protein [Bradyrhizobium]|uniref:hypothetical protein n=1 Tax=Bradyrhizobium TaxID=374 RepID=UPI001EDC261E|nr:hypothetical protein [Bradyrhizobium zhengyangense]MCG2639672.1 hypothetical protein [Bradyrhizobium zhengyangense]
MTYVLGLVGAAIVGAAAWFATSFVAQPIRVFFDLREEALRQLIVLDECEGQISLTECPEGETQRGPAKKLAAARHELRWLGATIIAFGQREKLATSYLKLFGYDPMRAGENLMIAAEQLGSWGPKAEAAVKQAKASL